MLVAPKDELTKEEKCGAVYHLSCSDYPDTYVGETWRGLKWRIPEYKWDGSPVADHMKSSGHHVDLHNVDGIQILDQEENWHRRGIKESIHIRIGE